MKSKSIKVADLRKKIADAAFENLWVRFWSQVHKTETCWEWTGKTYGAKHPYGQLRVPGMTRQLGPHRVAWLMEFGELPSDRVIMHLCDNPRCVRIDHLALGTQLENIQDMHTKGRARKASGENHGFAKLTWDKVREYRQRYSDGESHLDLTREAGITLSAMLQMLRGETWKEATQLDS